MYDAAGAKLKKITTDNTVNPVKVTTTLYMAGVYENDVLQFMGHEEGRIRRKDDGSFAYDYFLKDHLGNVRMVLTEEQKTDAYPAASMEVAQTTTEEALYANLNTTRTDKPAGYPNDTYTNPNDKLAKVRGDGNKIGPAIILKVMSGDKFNLRVNSWYKTNGTSPATPVNPVIDLLSALTNGIGSIAGAKASATELQSSGVLSPGATDFLNNQTYTGGKPKAYVNWILFDEQFKYVNSSSGFEQVGDDEVLTTHVRNEMPINKNGYLYIYVSNETPNIDVFFDNLQVTHIRGPILEEAHYYPFGLVQAGISSKALNNAPVNKAKFNGIEHNNDFDLNMYDAFYRNLDPQIGRFWQIDPKPNEAVSPYAAMLNNPIRFSDPLGDTTWLYNQNGVFMGVINNKKSKNQVHYIKTDGDPGQVVNFDKLSKKDQRAYEKKYREVSIAFAGSKTAADMKSLVDKSVAARVEIGFVGVIGKDKEIRLNALPIDAGNKIDEVPVGQQIDGNYSSAEQKSNLFLEGHTHIKAYLEALKDPAMMNSFLKNGLPNQSPSKPGDYTPALDRGNGKGAAPSMVITPFGVTLYGAGHMTPYGQPSPNNTYLNYKSLK